MGGIINSCATGGHLAQTGMHVVVFCSLMFNFTRNPKVDCLL